jgi:hypothetical protein
VPIGNVTGLGLKEAVRPGTFDGSVAVNDAVPWKHELLSVTVEDAELPATMTPGEGGEAPRPKLPVIVIVTLAVWTSDPAAPVVVTVYVPAGVEDEICKVKSEELEIPGFMLTLALGLNEVDMLATLGEREAVKPTLPEKPKLVSVIVEEAPPEPHTKVETWLAFIVKSAFTVTEIVTECGIVPLTAFKVTM